MPPNEPNAFGTKNSVAPHPNSPTRSLVQNAFDRGWDPTKIWDQDKGAYVDSVLPWDRARETFDRNIQNQDLVPPAPAHDKTNDVSGGPKLSEHLTWEATDTSREAPENGRPKRSLSDPTPDMPGA